MVVLQLRVLIGCECWCNLSVLGMVAVWLLSECLVCCQFSKLQETLWHMLKALQHVKLHEQRAERCLEIGSEGLFINESHERECCFLISFKLF